MFAPCRVPEFAERRLVDEAGASAWNDSAAAWLREIGDHGDYARVHVLDPPLRERIAGRGFATALDIGCGEGRFCRIMQSYGIVTVGIDPTRALIEHARVLDPAGEYRIGRAENLGVAPASFDLVVSYLSLIDIPDARCAIAQMSAALRPGGTLLIANLTSFNTAGSADGWSVDPNGEPRFCIDHYLDERAVWVSWRGIRVQNWHRPLETYMAALLANGLTLRHFAEPAPVGGDPVKGARYRRVPWFVVMEWEKNAA
jgi:SAM-dependent methyltransferase